MLGALCKLTFASTIVVFVDFFVVKYVGVKYKTEKSGRRESERRKCHKNIKKYLSGWENKKKKERRGIVVDEDESVNEELLFWIPCCLTGVFWIAPLLKVIRIFSSTSLSTYIFIAHFQANCNKFVESIVCIRTHMAQFQYLRDLSSHFLCMLS